MQRTEYVSKGGGKVAELAYGNEMSYSQGLPEIDQPFARNRSTLRPHVKKVKCAYGDGGVDSCLNYAFEA